MSHDTVPHVITAEITAMAQDPTPATLRAWCEQITCPSLVVLDGDDGIISASRQRELAAALGADSLELQGLSQDPVTGVLEQAGGLTPIARRVGVRRQS